jgi:hypothetical protein
MRLRVSLLLLLIVSGSATALDMSVQAKVRALGDAPVIIQTIPEDGSTTPNATPTFRFVFNTDMDTSRVDVNRVGLPAGLTVRQVVWSNPRTLDISYDGFLAAYGAKRVDLHDGYFITPGKISIPLGSGLAFNFADPNHPPIIVVMPNAITREGVTQFDSLGYDADGDPLTYAWDFGDGTTGSGARPAHTYNGRGPFLATLTVSDGRNSGSASASVLIGAAASVPWIVTRATLSLNFAKPGRDKLMAQGLVELPAGFDPTDKKLMVDVGGVQQLFTMNGKGQSKVGKDRLTLRRKLTKKVFLGGAVKIMFQLNGDFAGKLSDDGFVNLTSPKQGVKIPVTMGLVINTQPYEAIPELLYKSTQGKTGKASRKTSVR